MCEVIQIRDYERKVPQHVDPAKPATIIILPVILVERYDDTPPERGLICETAAPK